MLAFICLWHVCGVQKNHVYTHIVHIYTQRYIAFVFVAICQYIMNVNTFVILECGCNLPSFAEYEQNVPLCVV